MENDSHEPRPQIARACSTPHSAPVSWLGSDTTPDAGPNPSEVAPPAPDQSLTATGRGDGWTNDRMATFLEVLADTGIVSEACRAAGMSREGAYPLRNRDPVFAAAWRAAQAKARPVVADGLLERSITGTVEHFYRDGVLVGERRHFESWLGLAMLKRLDKQAEEDRRAQFLRPTGNYGDAHRALPARIAADWQQALDALRSGGTAAVAVALGPEVDEVDTPPPLDCDPDPVWRNQDGAWLTDFPPPSGFDGYESGPWDGVSDYERACTAEEAAILDSGEIAEQAAARAEEEAERDEFFLGFDDQ